MDLAVLVMRRAKITQPDMGFGADPFQQRLRKRRFIDAGFAGDQSHLPVAPLDLRPPAPQ